MAKSSTTKPVLCYKCGAVISPEKPYTIYEKKAFHLDCFNAYEHYNGLDKPID